MHLWKKRSIVLVVLSVFLMTVSICPALAQMEDDESDITTAAMIGDALVLRPLGFVATVLGTAFFLLTLPVTGPSGQTEMAQKKFVSEPGEFTFKRPLGMLP